MPDRQREQQMLMTGSLVVLAAVAIAFILWFTRGVMVPFVLAVFVVAVTAPLADVLETRLRFRRWMSVIFVLVLVLAVSFGFLLLMTYTATQIAATVGDYAAQAHTFFTDFIDTDLDQHDNAAPILNDAEQAAQPPTVEASEPSANDSEAGQGEADAPAGDAGEATTLFGFNIEQLKEQIRNSSKQIRSQIDSAVKDILAWGVGAAREGVGSAISILSTFFLMIIFSMFLLAARDPGRLKNRTYAEIETKIRSYLATKTILSLVTGILVTVILACFRLELAIVFGVLTFLLNFIPSVGSIIATLLPLPVAYGQFVATADDPNWWLVLGVLAIPGAVQMVIGNILEPRIMGEGVGLHPIAILFALAFWSLLWGPIGAILAVPITAVVQIGIARYRSLELVTDAMAGKLPD